jgi:hypothetical protein
MPAVNELSSADGLQGLHATWSSPAPMAPTDGFVGFGLSFANPPCVDARPFAGVRFTVTGMLGDCILRFGVVSAEDNSTQYGAFGSCTAGASCIAPASAPIVPGTTFVRFSDLSGGFPMDLVDAAALNDVQWMVAPPMGAAACSVDVKITDVAFVMDGSMPPPPSLMGCPSDVSAPCPNQGSVCVYAPPPADACLVCLNGSWQSAPCPQ